jgi:multicomponent Na+:H+ antiporter subunit E
MTRSLRLAPVLAVLWFALSDGAASGVWFGLFAVVLALGAAHITRPTVHRDGAAAPRLRWLAIPRFAAFFLGQSLLAGVDVARRTLSPSLPLDPAMRDVHLQLPPGPARVLLVATLSLLPGSLGVDLHDQQLTLHVLDQRTDIEREVREAERQVGALFGMTLA